MALNIPLIVGGVALAVGIGIGASLQQIRVANLKTDLATLEANTSKEDTKALDAALEKQKEMLRQNEILKQNINKVESTYLVNLKAKNNEIETLRKRISDGSSGLRVSATCESNGHGETSDSSTSSSVDATSPRLTDSAERNYFTLRERINESTEQIIGLQEYIKQVTNASK